MTFMFLVVILGTTHERAPVGSAGIAIDHALTLFHWISIPVTNTSGIRREARTGHHRRAPAQLRRVMQRWRQ